MKIRVIFSVLPACLEEIRITKDKDIMLTQQMNVSI